jgi:hypothetical protein
MNPGLILLPEYCAKTYNFMAFLQITPYRFRRHFFVFWTYNKASTLHPAHNIEAGGVYIFFAAYLCYASEHILSIAETYDHNPAGFSRLILHMVSLIKIPKLPKQILIEHHSTCVGKFVHI